MVIETEVVPPSPVHEIEKLLSPAVDIVTASEPEVEICEVQFAVQEEALDEDQVSVEALSKTTEVGSADKLTVGAGVVGGVGGAGASPPPPPPPPPQAEIINNTASE